MNETSTSGGEQDHAVNGEQPTHQSQNIPTSGTPNEPLQGNASFWTHMFSFDGHQKASPPPAEPSNKLPGGPPSQISIWLNTLRSLKITHLIEGFAFSPNFKCFALLAGFAGWLFVVNWVKEHDHGPSKTASNPVTNFGVAEPGDRALVTGIKGAYPYGFSAAPGPLVERPSRIDAGPGQAMSATYNGGQRFGVASDYFSAASASRARFGGQEPVLPSLVEPMQPMPVHRASDFSEPPAYNIQMNSMNGTWLKTVVTR